jgi:hypothetical protein
MVMYTATPLDISAQLANPKIGAVMHVGQPSSTINGVGELLFGTVRVFRQRFTLEDAIGSHACSLQASRRVTQWHSSRMFTPLTGSHCKLRPNAEGKTSPAGRTVQTVYPAEYQGMVSIFDFNMRPGPSEFPRPDCAGGCGSSMGTNPGRTHRFYTGEAVVPFGFGTVLVFLQRMRCEKV